MASSARIEELEKKFNENPRRYFAPLANEYRKAGDIEQAIAICRTYVPQQPAHMSGHIVFGQALYEAGQQDEARGVFEAALTLDPENLIALRHLGDIARARGEREAARAWYRRVLDADPRNDEVAGLLASIESMGNGAATARTSDSWEEINPERTLELPPGLVDAAAHEATMGGVPSALYDQPSAFSRPAAESAARPPEASIPESLWPDPEAAEDGGLDFDADRKASSPASGGMIPDPIDTDYRAPEPPPTDTTLGLEVMEFVPPPRDTAPAADASDMFGIETSDDTPSAFVTETMAELYLQQGFRDEALSVYRQLLARNPADPILRERVEQLERGAQSSIAEAAVVSSTVIEAATRRHAAPPPRSIRAFFGALAARRVMRPGETEPEATERGDAPAHTAAETAPETAPERARGTASETAPATSEAPATPEGRAAADTFAVAAASAAPPPPPLSEAAGEAPTEEASEVAAEAPSAASTAMPDTTPAEGASAPPDYRRAAEGTSEVTIDTGADGPAAAPPTAEAAAPPSDAPADTGPAEHGARPSGEKTQADGGFQELDATDSFGASALSSFADADRRGGVTETDDFSGDSLVPRPPGQSAAPGLAALGFEETVELRTSGEFGASALFAAVGHASTEDSASPAGEAGSEATRAEGQATEEPTEPAGSGRDSAARPAAADEPWPTSTLDNFPWPPAPSAEPTTPSASPAPKPAASDDEQGSSAERRRAAMQTGSVNVLFPGQAVSAPDEAAAQALASAYGGPSPRSGSGMPDAGSAEAARATRPVREELSLDSVFRETPAPSEPRREATAFSFDQFFGDQVSDATAGESTGADGLATDPTDPSIADAEQFSNWLAGLKKK